MMPLPPIPAQSRTTAFPPFRVCPLYASLGAPLTHPPPPAAAPPPLQPRAGQYVSSRAKRPRRALCARLPLRDITFESVPYSDRKIGRLPSPARGSGSFRPLLSAPTLSFASARARAGSPPGVFPLPPPPAAAELSARARERSPKQRRQLYDLVLRALVCPSCASGPGGPLEGRNARGVGETGSPERPRGQGEAGGRGVGAASLRPP